MFKKTIFSLALALISVMNAHAQNTDECIICLLYTSDAADE